MYNLLDQHKARITAYVDGLCGSIASYLFLVADERYIAENAKVFIHLPYAAVVGNADEHRRVADVLDMLRDDILNEYDKNTTLSREQLLQDMETATTYSAAQAVEYGFADSIVGKTDIKIAACGDLTVLNSSEKPIRMKDIPSELQKLLEAKRDSQNELPEQTLKNKTEQAFTNKHEDFTMEKDVFDQIANLGGDEFAAKMFREGKGLEDAKNVLIEDFKNQIGALKTAAVEKDAEIKNLKDDNASLKAENEKLKTGEDPFPASNQGDGSQENPGSGDAPAKPAPAFMDKVNEYMKANDCSQWDAISACSEQYEDLYRAFLDGNMVMVTR